MGLHRNHPNQAVVNSRRKATMILAILAPVLAIAWLLGGLAWPGEASLAQGTRVTVSPSSAQVAVGETVALDVLIEDVASLWGARVYLAFDPSILEVVDADTGTEGVQVARGDFIDPREGRSWVLVNQADNAAGTVEYAALLLNNARNPTPPANGSGVLARITFRGRAQGSSAVAFAAANTELYDGQGAPVQATTQNGNVTVSAGVRVYLPLVLRQRAAVSAVVEGVAAFRAAILFAGDAESSGERLLHPAISPQQLNKPTDIWTGWTASAPAEQGVVWVDNAVDEDEYLIERQDPGGAFRQIDTIDPSPEAGGTLVYRDENITFGQVYRYRVRAHRQADNAFSPYSDVVASPRHYDSGHFRIFYRPEDCPMANGRQVCVPNVNHASGVNDTAWRVGDVLEKSRTSFMTFNNGAGFYDPALESVEPFLPIDLIWEDGGGMSWTFGGEGLEKYGAISLAPLYMDQAYSPVTNTGEVESWLIPLHELFHQVQYAHSGALLDPSRNWLIEGQARSIQDKFCIGDDPPGPDPCPSLDDEDQGIASYMGEVKSYLDNANRNLTDSSYAAALFWTYVTEHYGTLQEEPHWGMDLMLRFWEEGTADPEQDGITTLNRALAALGHNATFEDVFRDFIVANYAKDLTGPNVPDRYKYFDESQPPGSYGGVHLDMNLDLGPDDQVGPEMDTIVPWGARYYQIRPRVNVPILNVEFRQDTDHPVYYTLLAIKNDDIAVEINESGRDLVQTLPNDGYERVVVIVGALGDYVNLRYGFNATRPVLRIVDPTGGQKAQAGDPTAPDKLVLKLEMLSSLGAGTPYEGIAPTDFAVAIGDRTLDMSPGGDLVSHAYVQGQYWLTVQAPTQPADGDYTLAVTYTTVLTDVEPAAVQYQARADADNVLVIDRSGSMASYGKMDDAQNAARLYVDNWGQGDKIGVVSFREDATVDLSLRDWNETSRQEAITQINGLEADGSTSIGDGLLAGLDQLTSRGDIDHTWALVLLSDGMENQPDYIDDFTTAWKARKDAGLTRPVVHAIAIGPDANRPDLQVLANTTGGIYLYAAEPPPLPLSTAGANDIQQYSQDLANDLAEYYRVIGETVTRQQQIFTARGDAQDIGEDESVAHTVQVDAGASEAVFVVNWHTRYFQTLPSVELYRPDGTLETADATDQTHIVYRVGSPPSGHWRLVFTRSCVYGEFCFDGTYLAEAAVKSSLTMELYIGSPVGDRLAGLEVPLLVNLTDSGPIHGATVRYSIGTPDGSTISGRLYDDGHHGDGARRDGVYGYLFRSTQESGSYTVRVTAEGTSNLGQSFRRQAIQSFHLEPDADSDGDGMPDTYEDRHDLNPQRDDCSEDVDWDGLTNCQEYNHGTNPTDADSDNGGENDGSEISRGSNPVYPADDEITPPRVAAYPGVNKAYVKFSVPAGSDHMRLYRSLSRNTGYSLIADNVPPTGIYTDTGLTNGTTYWYRMRAMGPAGQRSTLSPPVSVTPRGDSVSPIGTIRIDDGARSTASQTVQLSLWAHDFKEPQQDAPDPWDPESSVSGVTEMMLSNNGAFAGGTWEPYASTKTWTIAPRQRRATVYVKYRDAAGNVSEVAHDSIRYSPQTQCSQGGQVNVVFLMDTSGSMDDEFQALCNRIDRVVSDLQDQDITVQYEILGITQNKLCAADNVANRFPNAAADTPEDWGTAVADVAGNYPWREGYTRLVIPVSDEGPADGDPAEDPGADREIIDAAIRAAQAQQVIVSPVLGTFISENPANQTAIERLASDLAQATGGQLFSSTEPASDLAEGISSLIGSAACTPVPEGVHPNCDVDEETVVSVFGQNFLEGAQVLVDGQSARDVTVLQDPDRIAFRIPLGLADGTYDVSVTNPGLGQYTLPDALTVGPCTDRCEASQAGDIWTPMWDLWDGKMDLFPIADASGALTVGLFNGEGTFQVKVYDLQENLLGQMLVAEGETKTVSVPSTEDAEYRVFVAGGEAEHPHFRAFFRGAKRVALSDDGDDWERTEGVPFPGQGMDHGVESNAELGFDERWRDVSNVYADTIWYFHVSQSGTPLRVRVWSEYPEGDGHGGMEWVTPDEITIPLVGSEPAGFYHVFEVPEPQTGWWGLRVKADAPFTPWAQHYSLSRVWSGVGETMPPDFIYLLPTSMKPPPCGPSVTLDPPRTGACKSSVVPVDITVSDVNNLYGAEVHLSFDPAKLEVVDATRAVTDVIIPGPFPDPGEGQRLIAQNYADNTAGTIDYAVTLLHPAPAAFGEGVLARILFHVKEPGASVVRFLEGSKLDERPIPPAGPKPIPADWQGGLIIGRDCLPGQRGPGEIQGQVILQGRSNHSGAVVNAPPWPYQQVTGVDGTYSMSPMRVATYTVVITHTSYLRTDPLVVTVTAGSPISMPTAVLLGGDVNGDGRIAFVDAVIISLAYTYQRGEQGYVLAADIDADGVVDLDDLVMVGANWQCTVADTSLRCRRWRR